MVLKQGMRNFCGLQKLIVCFYIFLHFSILPCAADRYPKYPIYPLDTPLWISGNFGTLRVDHFHYGIDFALPNEREGAPVYAVSDGYVSRVKVSSTGYGKVVYIDHPDGYTSVYAHLQRFFPELDSFIYARQVSAQWFETEYFPKPGEFPITQKWVVGYGGNSGNSSGPHLHFEIRDTKTEEIINPLYFLPTIPDTIMPLIGNVFAWSKKNPKQKPNIAQNDTLKLSEGTWVIGAEIGDRMAKGGHLFVPFRQGMIYKNDSFGLSGFERFHFDHSRRVNTHFHYKYWWQTGKRIALMHQSECNPVPIYAKHHREKCIEIKDGQFDSILVFAEDFGRNHTWKYIYVIGEKDTVLDWIKPSASFYQVGCDGGMIEIRSDSLSRFNHGIEPVRGTFRLTFPSNAVDSVRILQPKAYWYQNKLWLEIQSEDSTPWYLPVKVSFTFELDLPFKGDSAVYASMWEGGAIAGHWEGHKTYTVFMKKPGTVLLSLDHQAPRIFPVKIPRNKKVRKSRFIFKARDAETGIAWAGFWIDGVWCLTEYDAKSDRIMLKNADLLTAGWHHILLRVKDRKGNESTFSQRIYIIPS